MSSLQFYSSYSFPTNKAIHNGPIEDRVNLSYNSVN